MERYNPKTIESKWQKVWAETKIYEVTEDISKKKIYATPMLPYPSGAGLHVGHVRNYSISDAVGRFYRQRGYNVLNAIGWDSFGLPAENYAIKTGTPPAESTATNIANFKNQLQRLGMGISWDRELDTSDPSYYKWTQWSFLQFFEKGLAFQAEREQWWCTQCKTVLANEQVINGKCWRHDKDDDPLVIKKSLNQWFFKITDYADDLLDATAELDWPESIKLQQVNWIGKSTGAKITFAIDGHSQTISVFTTRHDTQFGVTFMVLAPEHKLVGSITTDEHDKAVHDYLHIAEQKSDLERQQEEKTKTGVFTGAYAINPVNNQKIPIWVADYVLAGYGTGAVMGVPGHDLRDKEFAEKFGFDIVKVYETPAGQDDYHTEGKVINSGKYDGLATDVAREEILKDMSEAGYAVEKTQYKIRDWLISRQRYWGCPIPIIHCQNCGAVPVPEKDLPVILPKVEDFAPTGEAASVLAAVDDWANVPCPKCDKPGKRETDTMDGYVDDSWYMYRYTDVNNKKMAWDKAKLDYWWPVDFYFGGDHAVSHLLYFRFWNRFFVDQGLISADKKEPVKKLVYNGYINGDDGRKMSKSIGNVVDPLEIIDSGYGADALRMFELFIGPYDQDAVWNTRGVPGTFRYLQRVWQLIDGIILSTQADQADTDITGATAVAAATHKTIKKVTEDFENLKFNTAIAACMELVNTLNGLQKDVPFVDAAATWRASVGQLLQLLAPIAPHIAEELWQELGHDVSIHVSSWPAWDDDLLVESMINIVVQVNGKLRANIEVSVDASQEEIIEIAQNNDKISSHLGDGLVKKTIVVPGRLVNFVV